MKANFITIAIFSHNAKVTSKSKKHKVNETTWEVDCCVYDYGLVNAVENRKW